MAVLGIIGFIAADRGDCSQRRRICEHRRHRVSDAFVEMLATGLFEGSSQMRIAIGAGSRLDRVPDRGPCEFPDSYARRGRLRAESHCRAVAHSAHIAPGWQLEGFSARQLR